MPIAPRRSARIARAEAPEGSGRRWHGWVLAWLGLCALFLAATPADAREHPPGGRPGDISVAELPPQARDTLALLKQGGPFPYSRDGVTFGNREGLLPPRARGYYREYTVRTPGSQDRGARRIVAGQPGEYYYSDDHYRSFRRIRE